MYYELVSYPVTQVSDMPNKLQWILVNPDDNNPDAQPTELFKIGMIDRIEH